MKVYKREQNRKEKWYNISNYKKTLNNAFFDEQD